MNNSASLFSGCPFDFVDNLTPRFQEHYINISQKKMCIQNPLHKNIITQDTSLRQAGKLSRKEKGDPRAGKDLIPVRPTPEGSKQGGQPEWGVYVPEGAILLIKQVAALWSS